MRKTNIQPWTKEWDTLYQEEAIILQNIFKQELLDIHHIGSTAIPPIGYAKPIIDILMVVKDIHRIDSYNDLMKQIGYKSKGENGISGRRYFTKGNPQRTHHLHIFQEGNEEIDKHLVFTAYLLTHLKEAKQYGELKQKLKSEFPDDHDQYQSGKQAFVSKLAEQAIKWSKEH